MTIKMYTSYLSPTIYVDRISAHCAIFLDLLIWLKLPLLNFFNFRKPAYYLAVLFLERIISSIKIHFIFFKVNITDLLFSKPPFYIMGKCVFCQVQSMTHLLKPTFFVIFRTSHAEMLFVYPNTISRRLCAQTRTLLEKHNEWSIFVI